MNFSDNNSSSLPSDEPPGGPKKMRTESAEKNGLQNGAVTDRSRWIDAPLNERMKAFKNIYVVHRAIKDVAEAIERELLWREVEGKAAAFLVVGSSGSGKSKLVEHLKRLYPDEHTPELSRLRFVKFKVPKSPTPKSMSVALLRALGDPMPNKGTNSELEERIRHILRRADTKVVAIDDFQDVPATRALKGIRHISAWVRDLCDMEFEGVIVALGTAAALAVRESDDQLPRRMPGTFYLQVFGLDSEEKIKAYKGLMRLIDKALPLGEPSNLDRGNLILRIHGATNGILSYLMKLLGKALVRAVERGSECIEMKDLYQAFIDLAQHGASNGNPFDPDWNGDALIKPGQLFNYLHLAEEDAPTKQRKKRS